MASKHWLLAGVAGAAVTPTAGWSADLPLKYSPVMAPAAYSWTGFYIGGHLGAAWQQINQDLDHAGYGIRFTSFTGGGQIGYNWQHGNFLFGVEADGSWMNTKVETSDNYYAEFGGGIRWLSTIRGRAGLVVNDTMVYATGGVAFGGVKYRLLDTDGVTSYDLTRTQTGFAVGGGVEHMFSPNWIIGFEGLFVDLGKYTQTPSADTNFDQRFTSAQAVIARVKVNYKF